MSLLTILFISRISQACKLRYSVLLLLGQLLATFVHGSDKIVLGVPNFKPYTYLEQNQIKGSALPPVEQALKDLNIQAEIKLYPTYTDLLKALKRDDIQGFFLASKNTERDRHAEFSHPITLNNWTWFTLKNPKYRVKSEEFNRQALVGTIQKTNTFRWLTRNGFQTHGDLATRLPTLLIEKKLDAVFAAEAVFEQSSKELEISSKAFNKTIESSKPFGIYISRRYLKNHPGFMDQLNKYIEENIFDPQTKKPVK